MLLDQLRVLVTELFYPPRCKSCEKLGTYFCADCITTIVPFSDPRCHRCDMPLEQETAECVRCRTNDVPSLTGLRVVGGHIPPLKDAIHALKYARFREMAEPLGHLLAEAWTERGVPIDGLIPVPLHPERVRVRGFNQSVLLAQTMAEALSLPLYPTYLTRTRPTRPQVGLKRDERLTNVQDAFQANAAVYRGRWLLVDDVCTTGATLEGCALALRKQGAAQVWAITVARPLFSTDDQ